MYALLDVATCKRKNGPLLFIIKWIVSQRGQIRTESRPRVTCRMITFREVKLHPFFFAYLWNQTSKLQTLWSCGSSDMIADRHAYKHAQSHKQTRSSQLSALVFTLKVGELNRSGVVNTCFPTGVHSDRTERNWTDLTCTKLTQLQDALLVTCASVTKLIGLQCVRELQLANCSSVQFSSSAVNAAERRAG